MRVRILVLLTLMLSFWGRASAQRNEIGILIGAVKTGDRSIALPQPGSIKAGAGLAYQINFAHRLVNARLASLFFEVPIVVTPRRNVTSSNVLAPHTYSSLFLTPGLKLKVMPMAGLSPYGVLGVGYARFGESDLRVDNQPNTGTRGTGHGVFDFGGGVDMRLAPFVSLRGEVRDFVSGSPNFNVQILGSRQHNVQVAGGIVLRF